MGALVLVVDDSASIRGQIRGVLQQVEGFDDFIEAGDGLQAFKLMVDRRPDLVVCDLIMPVFDGLKFLALCATRPDYYAALSADSRRSLVLQGGVYSPAEAAALIARPHAADAVRVRLWDDLAKVPGGTTPPLAHFVAALEAAQRVAA